MAFNGCGFRQADQRGVGELSIWDILSQHNEITPNEYYEMREISNLCRDILREYQKKGLLDEIIIKFECHHQSTFDNPKKDRG